MVKISTRNNFLTADIFYLGKNYILTNRRATMILQNLIAYNNFSNKTITPKLFTQKMDIPFKS